MMYKQYPWLLQGSKWAITMRLILIESLCCYTFWYRTSLNRARYYKNNTRPPAWAFSCISLISCPRIYHSKNDSLWKQTHGLLSGLPILGGEKISRLYKKFSKLHEPKTSSKQ